MTKVCDELVPHEPDGLRIVMEAGNVVVRLGDSDKEVLERSHLRVEKNVMPGRMMFVTLMLVIVAIW